MSGGSGDDIAGKTARGALTSIAGQGVNFAVRFVSMVVLARLVTPEHFGLVGMVAAFTGLLSLFRDAGLSAATVQREKVSHELVSTLFWVNVGIGLALMLIAAAAAPALAAFYHEPRLIWITLALSTGFLFNGLLAQHRALLQRDMRFGTLAGVEAASAVGGAVIGIGMAMAGFGYWALVAIAVGPPAALALGMWCASGWMPGPPRRVDGLGSMIHYGGTITLNGLVVYVAYNADKVLVGRVFGAESLGTYGRAYQLISLPTENLHSTLGWVMFPALARVQSEPARLRSFFLKGYNLFLAIVVPVTLACALFAREIVHVFLGLQWDEAVPIFRYLAPTVLAFALINPMAHLMMATGYATRSLLIGLFITPVVIAGYTFGLSHGPVGVAIGFSAAMSVLIVPVAFWSVHGTAITMADLLRAALPSTCAALLGAAAAHAAGMAATELDDLPRLVLLSAILFGVHFAVLLAIPSQRALLLKVKAALASRQLPVPNP